MAKNPTGNGDRAGGTPAAAPYVVLARKYRPETFDDLIGQQAMVRTLRNAFASDRIAQGYMLTGVRGVGKTTTARILARALNYVKDGIADKPTVDMNGYGAHCLEIIQSRHPDVMEMDAASNTGIDSVREIIEGARYRPISGRYKVYIIDEVHMLSKSAFNALLKTLEEPPEHVKFIFATTEIRKVPVTVLSRCQRFDLRRVEVAELAAHLARIATAEGAAAEEEALTFIARAAGGSVRDALSILDQAIAMGAGQVTTDAVRAMLGLADRGRIFELLETVAGGNAKGALDSFDALYRDGGDALEILGDVAEAVHATTRAKTGGAAAAGEGLSVEERRRAAGLAERLAMSYLARLWQMLLKGIDEAARAPDQKAAVEMVLIRIAYLADLPSPDDVLRLLSGDAPRPVVDRAGLGGSAPPGGGAPQSAGSGAPRPQMAVAGGSGEPRAAARAAPAIAAETYLGPQSLAEVAALASAQRNAHLKMLIEDHVRLIRFERGHIEIALEGNAPKGLAGEIGAELSKWTSERWIVSVGAEKGAPTLGEVRRLEEARRLAATLQDPAVQAIIDTFPDAEVRPILDDAAPQKPRR